MRNLLVVAGMTFVLGGTAASAQTPPPEVHPFEGGQITITETDTGEKQVAFGGRLLGSNYFVFFDQEVEVGGSNVALISLGDGGNACGPGTLIVWKNGDEVDTDYVGEDCGAPSPAVTPDRIYFVPYLLPGANADVVTWSPTERLGLAGELTYKPQPETGWSDLDAASLEHIVDAFRNEAVYGAATALLGRDLEGVATGLLVGGAPETLESGIVWSKGCIPHNCGGGDAFMAIDPTARKLYFAQQSDGDTPTNWPPAATWPKDVRDAMRGAIGR
jgi:hypothetical protein